MTEIFDKDYFENGIKTGKSDYENYRWMPKMTRKEADAIIDILHLKKGDRVLDFGCAKGFMVRALREKGIDAWGVDVSKYAIDNADPKVKDFVGHRIKHNEYKAIIARTTLEHLTKEELKETLDMFTGITHCLLFSCPLADWHGEYILQVAEQDISHKIRWQDDDWMTFLAGGDWHPYRMEIPHLHEKYKGKEREGIGIFICYHL